TGRRAHRAHRRELVRHVPVQPLDPPRVPAHRLAGATAAAHPAAVLRLGLEPARRVAGVVGREAGAAQDRTIERAWDVGGGMWESSFSTGCRGPAAPKSWACTVTRGSCGSRPHPWSAGRRAARCETW